MRVVITGGNGYLGARLSLYLSEKGFQVIPICFSAIPDDENWKSRMSAIYQGDLRKDEIISLIANLKADAIIHLVSLDHSASEQEPKIVNEINVLPTWRLLDACRKAGLKKFIYFSTIHVYGKLENSIITETHPVRPENAYAMTHYLSENICDYYNRKTNTNVITARISNSYGEPILQNNNCWKLAINDLCKNAFLKKEICLLSDGSPQRDFIHGNDVCRGVEKLLNLNLKNSENNAYHISSGDTITLLDLAKKVREAYQSKYGKLLEIKTSEGTFQEGKKTQVVKPYQISNEKLIKTGFSLDYNLESGIQELFNYLEHNPVLISN